MRVFFGNINEKHQIEAYTNSQKVANINGWTNSCEEEEIARGYDGALYLREYLPEKPQYLINRERIDELKEKLAEYDYIGVKIATGCATIEDYADKIAQCEEWRAEINRLEEEDHAENENSENSDSEPLGILGL